MIIKIVVMHFFVNPIQDGHNFGMSHLFIGILLG